MFHPRRLVLGSFLLASAPLAAPVFAAPVVSNPAAAAKYDFAEDALEGRWSWRGDATLPVGAEISVALGWKDAKNSAFLSLKNDGKSITAVLSGAPAVSGQIPASATQGELSLQRVGTRTRVLWNGQLLVEATQTFPGNQFGTATRGGAVLDTDDSPQPTEPVVFRDDFMRAEGPEDQEIPGEWKVSGVWKTSGSLGPKSDAALNPNPFVFRAQSAQSIARAGKWWWSDYSVSASVRAAQNEGKSPLIAGLDAFTDAKGGALRAEVDFNSGIASIKEGDKVLAQSPAFDAEPGQWHRLRFEPGPGTARLYMDGILRVSAPVKRAQGGMALRASVGGANFIDFDDVRVGALQNGTEWGEGALPERFIKDRLMRNWASAASAWKRDTGGVWWNTGDFFGAATLNVDLPFNAPGDGFEIIFGADPKNERSGVRYQISRTEDKKELIANLGKSSIGRGSGLMVPLGDKAVPLHLDFMPKDDGTATLTGTLNGQKIEGGAISLSASLRGTKLGIRPLKNGAPLPPPALQNISVSSATYERENRAMIGVNFTPITDDIARHLGLSGTTGALVDNVDAQSPAKTAGVQEGDVIHAVDGVTITDIDSMKTAVGAVKPGTVIKLDLLRPANDVSGLDWSQAIATSPNVVDYSFTAAPVDWRAARGTWNVAERWTCSPQWSFFAGLNDTSPLLWSRFATQWDWTLEAYLATPMDLARGERSPSDLNISVGGDGVDLASGYSFIFGGKTRTVNQIWRGDAVAWEKPFEMPAGLGETHQDWFYIRLEKRQTPQGVRFRYSVNGRELANYLDPNPLSDGGHVGFWTQNGALSIARVRMWYAGMKAPQSIGAGPVLSGESKVIPANALGNWSPRGAGNDTSARLILASQTTPAPKQALQIINPRSGGDWTTYVTRKSFDANTHPILDWDYQAGSDVKVNLYALVDDTWREIGFTAGASNDPGDVAELGNVAVTSLDAKWRHAHFDLLTALHAKGLPDTVQALAFAAPARDYLRAGLGGNHRGASYWIRDFQAGK